MGGRSSGTIRFSQVLAASLKTYHALRRTPADPWNAHQNAFSVSASRPLTRSPSAFGRPSPQTPICGYINLQKARTSLWPMLFPVYASIVSFGLRLLYYYNIRYEWRGRHYSPGAFTLEETPSFTWHNYIASDSWANPSSETNQQTSNRIHAGGVPNLHGRFNCIEEVI